MVDRIKWPCSRTGSGCGSSAASPARWSRNRHAQRFARTRSSACCRPMCGFPTDRCRCVRPVFEHSGLGYSAESARYASSASSPARSRASPRAVQAEMNTIAGRLAAQYPGESAVGHARRWCRSHEVVSGAVRRPLLVLLGAVGFVLFIACVNLAGTAARARRSGVHAKSACAMALGATGSGSSANADRELRARVCGGIAGLASARWMTSGLLALGVDAAARERRRFGSTATVLAFSLRPSVLSGLARSASSPRWRMSSANV